MNVTRRDLLAGAAASVLLPAVARAQSYKVIQARAGLAQIAPQGYARTPIWGYDGQVPGPEIRVPQGARVQRQLLNALPQPTALHWHGIRIENAMDGVPGLTQRAVQPGATFDYDFRVPDAGTYWYHSHNQSMEQVARGLQGPLIVDEADRPDVDHDLTLMIDDWRLDPETVELMPFGNRHDLSHGGRIGNIVTVNGQFEASFAVRRHDRLRLRLINTANARVFTAGLRGLKGWIVALDGMPVARPIGADVPLVLAPAQRMDLIVDVTATPDEGADLLSIERDGGYALAGFKVSGQASRARRAAPAALPPNPVPALGNLAAAPLYTMPMQGGAMRGLAPSMYKGQQMQPRALAQQGKFWALGGTVDLPDIPFFEAPQGQTVRVALVNETAFDHAMHLHGHHFHVLNADGTPGPLRDTVLIAPGRARQIALVADNPGDWLFHCHMLGHAMAGMKSWVRVSA